MDGEQHVVAVVELLYGIGELAPAKLFRRLDGAATLGDVRFQSGDQLVEILVQNVRTNNKHDFVRALHGYSPILPSSPVSRRLNSFIAGPAPWTSTISTARAARSRTSSRTTSCALRMG